MPASQVCRVTLEGGGRTTGQRPGATKRADLYVANHRQDKRSVQAQRAQVLPGVDDEGSDRLALRHPVPVFQENVDRVHAGTRQLPARLVDRDVDVDTALGISGQVGEGDGAAARLVVGTVELAAESTLELRACSQPGIDVHGQHFIARGLRRDFQMELELRRTGVDPRGLRKQLQAVGASGDIRRWGSPLDLDRALYPGSPVPLLTYLLTPAFPVGPGPVGRLLPHCSWSAVSQDDGRQQTTLRRQ